MVAKQDFMHRAGVGRRQSGFTLVELLVVVAIIALVAGASLNAYKGAQRQARAVKCQANLHSLYKAVISFHADSGYYPCAGAYEEYNDDSGQYRACRGWVTWVRSDGTRSRRNDDGNLYKGSYGAWESKGEEKSQANNYCYVGTGALKNDYNGAGGTWPKMSNIQKSNIYRSIDEGAIFVYADKNFSIYCCDEFKNKKVNGANCRMAMRSYAMNKKFGCARVGGAGAESVPGMANRLALFVEQDAGALTGSGKRADNAKGSDGNSSKRPEASYTDDAIWDWDKGEIFGAPHKKSGSNCGHVMFADGHIESVVRDKNDATAKEVSEAMGKGEYGDD